MRRRKRQKNALDLQLVKRVSSLISVLPTSCAIPSDESDAWLDRQYPVMMAFVERECAPI